MLLQTRFGALMSSVSILSIVLISMIVAAAGAGVGVWLIAKRLLRTRMEKELAFQQETVTQAGSLLECQEGSSRVISSLQGAQSLIQNAAAQVKKLDQVLQTAAIKTAIAKLKQELASLEKVLANKLEDQGVYLYQSPDNNNSGNGSGSSSKGATARIQDAMKKATTTLNREVKFQELLGAIKASDSSIKDVSAFSQQPDSKQESLIAAALVRLTTSASTNGNGKGATIVTPAAK
jgi:hypothetical protein